MNKKMYVYRYLDYEGNVLYVGQTDSLERRHSEHVACETDYFTVYKRMEYFETTEKDVDALEAYFIEKYSPVYNIRKPKVVLTYEQNSFVRNVDWKKYNF